MLKREKEVFQNLFDKEEDIIKALEKHYRDALHDINMSIRIMQSDPLTQSKVYQLEYQKALKKQVEGILERMHAKEYTTIQEYLSDSYRDAFVGTMYSMHGQGIPIIAAIDQNAAVKAVITDSAIREGLYEHLAVGVDGMKKAIRQELTRGIASNMAYADIARNIESTTKAPLANAKNIVRTEGHRIQQASAHDARKVSQSKGADVVKQWDATLDGATRKIHRDLDGKIVEVDEHFTHGSAKAMYPGDFGDPGLDCQCRCVALTRARWALDEGELETLKERAAFFKLDKTDDFEDFKKKYLKAAETVPGGQIYNSKTMKAQYMDIDAMNEFDYYSENQERFRLQSIKEMTGVDDKQAQEYLEVLCGERSEYLRVSNGGGVYQNSWFNGADGAIRMATSGEYREKADIIHDYIVRSPKYEGEIYRGMSLNMETIEEMRNGGIFVENGLLSSWTSTFDVASMFAEGRSEELGTLPVILKTSNPQYGTPTAHLSIFGHEEDEVLVSNIVQSQYKIGDVYEKDGITIIELIGG